MRIVLSVLTSLKEPEVEELANLGRGFHSYYMMDRTWIEQRIKEINKLLKA